MDLPAKLQLLKQVPYFASLPPKELRELAAGLRERHYQAGDVIFRKGEPCEGLCLVLSGRVRTVTTSAEGREQVLKVFGPGRTFAEIPVFDDEPLPADAVAVTDSTIAILPPADVVDILRHHPDVALDVIRLFASRLRAYKVFVEDLCFGTLSHAWPSCSWIAHEVRQRLLRTRPACVFSTLKMRLRQWSGQYVRSSSAR